MSKIYKIRMNCVSFVDLAVEADSKNQARLIAESYHSQCDSTEFSFGGFIDFDESEQLDIQKSLSEEYGSVVQL